MHETDNMSNRVYTKARKNTFPTSKKSENHENDEETMEDGWFFRILKFIIASGFVLCQAYNFVQDLNRNREFDTTNIQALLSIFIRKFSVISFLFLLITIPIVACCILLCNCLLFLKLR